MTTCNRCNADIRFVRTLYDKWMPLDAEPHHDGNVVIRPIDGKAIVLSLQDRDDAIEAGQTIWRTHFVSCPALQP